MACGKASQNNPHYTNIMLSIMISENTFLQYKMLHRDDASTPSV